MSSGPCTGQQKPFFLTCVYSLLHMQTVPQALSFSSGADTHADFATVNADINSPSASYILKLANRLYGETTSKFLQVGLQMTGSQ